MYIHIMHLEMQTHGHTRTHMRALRSPRTHRGVAASTDMVWLRKNGVNTNGAAAKVRNFDSLGTKVRPGTFGR